MILIITINNVYCGWWDSFTNSTKNESTITAAQPSSLEGKEKIPIDDIANDQEMNDELHTISSLYSNYPNTNGNYTEATPYQTKPYDRDPQQSPFVDSNVQHPTESHEMDPRFAQRRQCQEGTYMCRKVNPQQDHIRCIPNEWKCNGVRECEENDDEENCSYNMHRPAPNGCKEPEQYTCYGSGINGLPAQCIDSRKLCDGTYDCIYGDDEQKDRCPKTLF
ncbi:hypothetical protein RDWZM_010323 [Blomia tropicalis]|uniref:Uncharacterized protein n=1 Tax=Blomia tropicalis TaxID=40697 RepID=A0A9Q0LWJ3_BLOTA|nr:hypothetical protein RDWZM_010323 [Blomia tropicalis]